MLQTILDNGSALPGSWRSKKLGLLCHQASVNRRGEHTWYVLRQAGLQVNALYGPQHGLFGHTQDNMIEWRADDYGELGVRVYSLYGEQRQPTSEMFADIDLLLIDLQDVGSRYYTFIWTMALCFTTAAEIGLPVAVIDRPNPIGGLLVEGPLQARDYLSFVGLKPIPVRHGLTIAEIARYLQQCFYPGLELDVIACTGWQREADFSATGLPWLPPSPNMPYPSTALVYPGQCLLEATNISEGRGTTRPFEICGAPWLDEKKMARYLQQTCPGAVFQPWYFVPTFHKYAGELCRGVFIRVIDSQVYRPLATSMAMLSYIQAEYPQHFSFNPPPYEYEMIKLPIDILSGSPRWRELLQQGAQSAGWWSEQWQQEEEAWQQQRRQYFLY
jgi:uncharacterized protein YbbC (DUF1343 family)